MKTRAEQGLAESFERVAPELPGGQRMAGTRRRAMARFAEFGLPHRRVEAWKYTDLRTLLKEAAPPAGAPATTGVVAREIERALAASLKGMGDDAHWMVLIDGRCAGASGAATRHGAALASMLAAPPAWLEAALARASGSADGEGPAEAMLALNTAFMTDGLVLDVPDGAEISEPIHLVLAVAEGDAASRSITTRNVIRVGKGARVTLVESHLGSSTTPRQANTVTQVEIGDGADVTHVKLVDVAAGDAHIASWLVRLGADCFYRPFQMSLGRGLVRNHLAVELAGGSSLFDLAGTAIMDASGHADTTLVVDHKAAHATSRELFLAVLAGAARGVFQGKVIVQPGAQKTDGKMMARALMLSPDAEFNSKPELEIYADDVVCGHGSTASEIDPELIFYCRSRGIPEKVARGLLVQSFVGEAIDKVAHEGLREALATVATARLAGL